MFKVGTGALGWTPEVTLNTPIPQIILAIEGKFDFAVKTNPFGAKKKPTKEQEEELVRQRTALTLAKLDIRNKGK